MKRRLGLEKPLAHAAQHEKDCGKVRHRASCLPHKGCHVVDGRLVIGVMAVLNPGFRQCLAAALVGDSTLVGRPEASLNIALPFLYKAYWVNIVFEVFDDFVECDPPARVWWRPVDAFELLEKSF